MRIEGIWGMIVAAIIVLVLGLFTYSCLKISSRYDEPSKKTRRK